MKSAVSNSQRIRKSSDFLRIKVEGKIVSPHRCLSIAYRKTPEGGFRFGLTIPKRVGTAVLRNRLKRISRSSLSHYLAERGLQSDPGTANIDINLIFRPMAEEFYENLDSRSLLLILQSGLERILRISVEPRSFS